MGVIKNLLAIILLIGVTSVVWIGGLNQAMAGEYKCEIGVPSEDAIAGVLESIHHDKVTYLTHGEKEDFLNAYAVDAGHRYITDRSEVFWIKLYDNKSVRFVVLTLDGCLINQGQFSEPLWNKSIGRTPA